MISYLRLNLAIVLHMLKYSLMNESSVYERNFIRKKELRFAVVVIKMTFWQMSGQISYLLKK